MGGSGLRLNEEFDLELSLVGWCLMVVFGLAYCGLTWKELLAITYKASNVPKLDVRFILFK